MTEKKRTFEATVNLMPLSLLQARKEKEQGSSTDIQFLNYLESMQSTPGGLPLSRDLILRLIEVIKNK